MTRESYRGYTGNFSHSWASVRTHQTSWRDAKISNQYSVNDSDSEAVVVAPFSVVLPNSSLLDFEELFNPEKKKIKEDGISAEIFGRKKYLNTLPWNSRETHRIPRGKVEKKSTERHDGKTINPERNSFEEWWESYQWELVETWA